MSTATEARDGTEAAIDRLEEGEAVAALIAAQQRAAACVAGAAADILRAARAVAAALSSGGKLIYCGAGSSGLMALADALELPGTYGVGADRAFAIIAGGTASLVDLAGGYEDDRESGAADVAAAGIGEGDVVIAIAASGRTPYALGAAEAGRRAGATVIALSNNADAPLLDGADIAIVLATPPEPVAGSTRLGAATAQKIALNLLSTLAAIRLGHVLDGMMVNLVADNDKLRARARGIVAALAGVPASAAEAALATHRGAVKPAVLGALGATAGEAERLLAATEGNLRAAIARFTTTGGERRDPTTNQGSKT